jgi:hypothetical protein
MAHPADPAYAGTVRAWAAHLIEGGSTPWSEWTGTDHPAVPGAGELPSAPQLEVVRRLADRQIPQFPRLAELILATAGPGRGLIDVPLTWPVAEDAPRFGAPPMDPGKVPADELLRVCVGVLGTLVRDWQVPPVLVARRRAALWRKSFAVHGSPGTATAVRAALLAQGLSEGGRRATQLVIVRPLDAMMAEQWGVRVRGGAGMTWERLWEHAAANDRLPPALDVAAIADRMARTLGAERVHVILAHTREQAAAAAAGVLGVRMRGELGRESVAATDLVRRLNVALTVSVGEISLRALSDALRELTAGADPGADDGELGAPLRQFDWSRRTGREIATELRGARYSVHGDPGVVIPTDHAGRRAIDPADTLAVALTACVRAWQRTIAEED